MNVREAILAAADQIERHPETFDFMSTDAPDNGCGSPGCAIGWIGVFSGMPHEIHCGRNKRFLTDICHQFLGLGGPYSSSAVFYDRMRSLSPVWARSAAACAATLRKYADTYHPAPVVPLIPTVPVDRPLPFVIQRIFRGEKVVAV